MLPAKRDRIILPINKLRIVFKLMIFIIHENTPSSWEEDFLSRALQPLLLFPQQF